MSTVPPAVLPEWHVDVEGCTNFRDAGGWELEGGGRMRRGRLYRADDALRITDVGRRTVAALGLVAAVDLRQHAQFERGPGFLAADRTTHIPLVDRVIDPDNPPTIAGPADLADLYDGMLDGSRDQIARALDAIADGLDAGPVVVNCAFGKDRTGLLCALVQASIGVPAASIVADYGRSDAPTRHRRAWTLAEPLPDDPPTSHVPPLLFTAPADAMQLLVERMVARHGSLARWAAALPTRRDTSARLRHALVDR